MSRLLIKNLPADLTPDALRAHFSRADGPGGTLTDARVARTPDGRPRRFGFVGYKTAAEAAAAQAWFDKSFVGSARVRVEIVDGVKDAPAPRPNKRARLGPSPHENDRSDVLAGKPSKVDAKVSRTAGPRSLPAVARDEKDPVNAKSKGKGGDLEEFMEVMQPRAKKGPAWANGDAPIVPPGAAYSKRKEPRKAKAVSPAAQGEADFELGEGASASSPAEDVISDLDWMRRRMTAVVTSGDGKEFVQSDDEDGDVAEPSVAAQPAEEIKPEEPEQDPTRATILQTARLFVRNLAFTCTGDELNEVFAPFGEVSQVHIPLDPTTKNPKGVAYVTFARAADALTAFDALDGTTFQGRLVHILAAVDRRGKVLAGGEDGDKKRTLKEERGAQRKATAGREFNWGMLYMNSDAVASSIADRMNISKADILNPESDNAAVKLALAETHVIQETKAFLAQHGVVLSAFSSSERPRRSDTTLLVKNIPYGTGTDQIRELFAPHGDLARVLVPPAGTMAVVDFVHADDAARAFRAVAYRRLGNAVIYLEKAPVGVFAAAADGANKDMAVDGVAPVTIPEQAQSGKDADEPALAAGSTLFVKNLAFATTDERFARVFRHLPGFAFARVQTKPDPKRPGEPDARLSMGYGFVGFRTPEAARSALRGMQGQVLDGHALAVKFAGRGAEEDKADETKGKATSRTTKMIVKNVPFEATKKDIRELFGAHGQLKSVRLPKKFDHRTRGFAFLEFLTRQEAENAYETLRHTHLLGRHLVLEWAAEGEQDLEVLRQKAGVGFGGGKELAGKKRKLQLGSGDHPGDDES